MEAAVRSSNFLAPFVLATIAFAAAGCSSNSSAADDDSSAGALEETSCTAPAMPTDLDGFKKLSSCQLGKLFDDENAKAVTSRVGMPDGPYDGIPLCRKDLLKQTKASDLPRGARDAGVSKFIYSLLEVSDTADNSLASEIWHGKLFTREPGAPEGDVLNFIDATENDINADTRKAAEARYFIDQPNQWLVLNYANASSGLRVLKNVTVDMIRHVWDTARLVDEQRGIYLGMAWFIDKPGEYTPEISGTTAPSCYFALKRHEGGIQPKDAKDQAAEDARRGDATQSP
jgi:hypothetical protein